MLHSRRSRSRLAGVCLALLGIAAAPALARAGGDGVRALSVFGAVSGYTLEEPEEAPLGGVLGLSFERGFSDALGVRVALEGGLYHGTESGLSYAGRATAGLVYAFDVLKYVPYAGLGVGAAVLSSELETGVDPYLELLGGLDVLQSRSFSYGAQIRIESFLVTSAAVSVGLRATWRWGFF